MANCSSCEKPIKLVQPNTQCPKCQNEIVYHCWNCATDIIPWKTGDECQNCTYWNCPSCHKCGNTCELQKAIDLLKPQASTEEQLRIKKMLYVIRDWMDKRFCYRGNSHTFAKNQMPGYLTIVRNEEKSGQKTKFTERVDQIEQHLAALPVGEVITIGEIKSRFNEQGFYGKEIAHVLQHCVCIGKLKRISYFKYQRMDLAKCSFYDEHWKNVRTARCHKCKKQFPPDQKTCTTCTYQKRSKSHNRGDAITLKVSSQEPLLIACQELREHFEKKGVNFELDDRDSEKEFED